MTLPLARKIRELVDAGARVIGGKRLKGAPGLTGFPRLRRRGGEDRRGVVGHRTHQVGRKPGPRFSRRTGSSRISRAKACEYIHRRVGEADIYFVSNQENRPADAICARSGWPGKRPELWDPETGAIRALPEFAEAGGRITVPLRFEPMQSWFVVFRNRQGFHAASQRCGRKTLSLQRTAPL